MLLSLVACGSTVVGSSAANLVSLVTVALIVLSLVELGTGSAMLLPNRRGLRPAQPARPPFLPAGAGSAQPPCDTTGVPATLLLDVHAVPSDTSWVN